MRLRHAVLPSFVAGAALLGLPACGGNGGSTPSGPQNANVAGSWDFAFANLSATVDGVGVSCSASRRLDINQSGSTFSGTAGGGILFCQSGGVQLSLAFGSEPIINGGVSGNSVSFDFSTPDFHQQGTVSGNSMSGTASWLVDVGGTVGRIPFTGSWGASRISGGSGSVAPSELKGIGDVLGRLLP